MADSVRKVYTKNGKIYKIYEYSGNRYVIYKIEGLFNEKWEIGKAGNLEDSLSLIKVASSSDIKEIRME